ncbi:MAG: TRAP transporter small permease subunit [Desulfocapsaceae bacterium]
MLKRLYKAVDRSFQLVEEWSLFTAVCVALITAMANVILRKTTDNFSLYWSDEVVRKVIFFSTYIGCVAAVRSRSLIRIDALPQLLPILKKPLTLISHLAVLLFSGIMVYLGTEMTIMMLHDEFARTATLRLPEWLFYAVLPVMGAMMFLRTLIIIWEDLMGSREITGEQ